MLFPLFVLTPAVVALIGLALSAATGVGGALWSQKKNQSKSQQQQNAFNAQQQELQNAFNANEAALQRDWSAAEAERARDWNEEMYEKYNSLPGKIAQAEQAGVNPMLAVTGQAVSPVSASSSAPSGASASGSPVATGLGGSSSDAFTALIGQISGLAKLKSEIELNESMAEKNRADAEGQKITNESLRDMNVAEIMSKLSQVELNDANINLISAKVLNTEADTDLKASQLGQIAAQIANTEADTAVKRQQIAVLLSDIAKNEASVNLMYAQSKELGQRYENLVQEFGHKEVMYAIEEVSSSRDAGTGDHSNGYYRAVSEVKRFIDSFLGWFSGGASVTKNFVDKK